MDFVSDSLHDGRRFRVLTLVDHFSRVSPAFEVESSITGKRVVAVLERLRRRTDYPGSSRRTTGRNLPPGWWTNRRIATG